MMLKSKKILLLLSFVEGGCVMATELIGAKLMTPFFGTSLYVWSAVLAATLMALATGYFAGGVLSAKSDRLKNLMFIVLLAGIFMMLLPLSIKFAISLFGNFSIVIAIIATAIMVLMPPLFMMGCVSPIIIAELSAQNPNAGYVSGSIYALSTIGGILFTFLFGFYIIPNFGLKVPAFITGLFFALLPLAFFFYQKKQSVIMWFLVVFVVSGYYNFRKKTASRVNTLYEKEGMLGKIKVADFIPKHENDPYNGRLLLLNGILQTYVNRSSKQSLYFDYHKAIIDIIKQQPSSNKVLVLGLGGGTLTQAIYENGNSVEVCEIDKRMHEVALKFFDLDKNIPVNISDARQYINQLNETFNIVIMDLFKGEEHPYHVFTVEAIKKIKKHLSDNGLIIMNIHGYLDGKTGKGNRALLNTISYSGFHFKLFPQGDEPNNPDRRNLLLIASPDKEQLKNVANHLQSKEILFSAEKFQNEPLLQDEFPNGDLLFAEAARKWRTLTISSNVVLFGE